jgi:hypothetical protein
VVHWYFRNAPIVANYPPVGLPLGFKPMRPRFRGRDVKTFGPLRQLQSELRQDFEALLAAIPDEQARQRRRRLANELERLRSSGRTEDHDHVMEIEKQLWAYRRPFEWERRAGQRLARTMPVVPQTAADRISAKLPRTKFYRAGGLSADYESDLDKLLYYGLALALSRGVLSRLARCDHCGRPVLRRVLRYEPDEGVFCIDTTKCRDAYHNERRQNERKALAMRRYRRKRKLEPAEMIVPRGASRDKRERK